MNRRADRLWNTPEQLIELLRQQIALLQAQVAALEAVDLHAATQHREAALVCKFILLGNANTVAKWAGDMGWRRPKQPTKRGPADSVAWTGPAVLDLVDNPPPTLDPALAHLARELSRRNQQG